MGGNLFKDKTKPILKENIHLTVDEYFKEMKRLFPNKANIFNTDNIKFLGSVLKKDVSCDIDLGIDKSSISDINFSDSSIINWGLNPKEVKEQMLTYKKRARSATDPELMTRAILKGIVDRVNKNSNLIYFDEKKVTSGNIFSLFPQYSSSGEKLSDFVQIDWMIGNLEWLEFSYYSETYKGNIKGLHRTQLILSIFNHYGMSFNHTKGVSNLETKEILARTPSEAIEILDNILNTKMNKKITNYFKILDVVNSLPKADKNNIIGIYLKILDKTRCDVPEDLQKTWKSRQEELNLTGKFLPENSKLR